MPTTFGRCDDPECSCRSPELRLFTDQVLRRDANRTDYMVIPLIAGVMARCILADDAEASAPTRLYREAKAIQELADRGRTEPWDGDLHAYGIVANLVFCNWPAAMAWGSVSYERTILRLPFSAAGDQRMSAAVRFLGAQPPPSLTESVIVALLASMESGIGRGGVPMLGKAGRRVRVVLADRLRRDGLVTWPRILAAAVDDWTIRTVELLAQHNAAAGDAALRSMIDELDQSITDIENEGDPAEPSGQGTASGRSENSDSRARERQPADEAEAAEQLIADAVAEIEFWRGRRDAVEKERDTFAQRDARSRSRVESLERQLAAERVKRQALERELADLHAQRERYVERVAAEEALLDDAPPPAPDTFAGRRVLFFSGIENADARAALAQGFWDLGAAQVDTYWTDKTRGPDAFPGDAIIAMDVSHMAHATWSAILEKAKSAGAWWYWGKHGATTMARATAAAWSKHRERDRS